MLTNADKIRDILDVIEDALNYYDKEKLYTRICLKYAHGELEKIYEEFRKQETDYIECMTDEMLEEFEEINAEELAEFEANFGGEENADS